MDKSSRKDCAEIPDSVPYNHQEVELRKVRDRMPLVGGTSKPLIDFLGDPFLLKVHTGFLSYMPTLDDILGAIETESEVYSNS